MIIGKTVLLAAVLASSPVAVAAAGAQDEHNTMAAQQRDRANDRDSDRHDMRDRDRDHRDMHDRDRDRDHDRDMHRGWRNGHHYGWHRHCMMR